MTRSIVITGASKGIGWATAEALATAGWEVIGVARHPPASFPGQFVSADLSDQNALPNSLPDLRRVATSLASLTTLGLQNTSDLSASISPASR